MTTQDEKLERDILILFERACRRQRLDVAEHLLCALEAAERKPRAGAKAMPRPLRDAYLAVERLARSHHRTARNVRS